MKAESHKSFVLLRNAIQYCWLRHFDDLSKSEDLEQVRSLLPVGEFPIDWELTLLHKTVLQLNNLDLDTVLKNLSIEEINSRDANGRTALWWAAKRSDLHALTLLIQYGADVNMGSNTGYTPLGAALFRRSQSCAWALLNANTDVTKVRR